jgi:hypothetical protein
MSRQILFGLCVSLQIASAVARDEKTKIKLCKKRKSQNRKNSKLRNQKFSELKAAKEFSEPVGCNPQRESGETLSVHFGHRDHDAISSSMSVSSVYLCLPWRPPQ